MIWGGDSFPSPGTSLVSSLGFCHILDRRSRSVNECLQQSRGHHLLVFIYIASFFRRSPSYFIVCVACTMPPDHDFID